VAHLYEAHRGLPRAQGFHDAVDTVARQAEDRIHAPINDAFDQYIRSRPSHSYTP
jgi:hypothetical protein